MGLSFLISFNNLDSVNSYQVNVIVIELKLYHTFHTVLVWAK